MPYYPPSSSSGSSALSGITAATAANTIASGVNSGQVWNWALTADSVNAFTFGETTAATGGTSTLGVPNQVLLRLNTLAASTMSPLSVYSRANHIFSVSPDTIQIYAANGSTANPIYSFASQTGSGFLVNSVTGRVTCSVAGAVSGAFNSTGLLTIAGSATSPSLSDTSFTNSGFWWPASGVLSIGNSSSGEWLRWSAGLQQFSKGTADAVGYLLNSRKARGSVESPTVITTGDDLLTVSGHGYVGATNTYVEAANILIDSTGTIVDTATGIGGIIRLNTRAVGGALTEVFRVQGGTVPQILAADGVVGNPAYSFSTSVNTGMYQSAAGTLAFAAAGDQIFRFAGGQFLMSSLGTPTAPIIAQGAATSTGLLWNSTDPYLGITANGKEQVQFGDGFTQWTNAAASTAAHRFFVRKARGTFSSPTVITTGDDLASIGGFGYVGATNTFVEAGRIVIDSTGTISDSTTGIGGFISFVTRNVGGSLTERARVNEDGGIQLISVAAPVAVNGNLWQDSTQNTLVQYTSGLNQKVPGVPFVATGSATVTNTVTETTLVGSGVGTATLPANFFVAGKTVRITAAGVFSTDPVSPSTVQFRVRLGGIAGTVVLDTAAIAPSASITNQGWSMTGLITCRTTGVTGTVFSQGVTTMAIATSDGVTLDMENTAATTIDTTASQLVVLSMQYGAADVDDTITCTNLVLEVLN